VGRSDILRVKKISTGVYTRAMRRVFFLVLAFVFSASLSTAFAAPATFEEAKELARRYVYQTAPQCSAYSCEAA